MTTSLCVRLLAAVGLSAVSSAGLEIATRKMLGSEFDQRPFYVRQAGGCWRKTCDGPPFRLPNSASNTGGRNMQVAESVRRYADLTIVHGNHRSPEEKRRRIAELHADVTIPGPVYMNEDNNGRETTPDNLTLECASCDAVFGAGGSWGYMPWVQAQIYPFRSFLPGTSPALRPEMSLEDRDLAYFKALLEHIRSLVIQ